MAVLGLHCGRGASVALVNRRQALLLLERERLVRRKQAEGMDVACLHEALRAADVDKMDIDRSACVLHAPQDKGYIEALLKEAGIAYEGELSCYSVHQAHAACAFYQSGFAHSLVLSRQPDPIEVDGKPASGEGYFASKGKLQKIFVDRGVGPFVYNQTAHAMGLGAAGGAGKLMGLAPYGTPDLYREGDELLLAEDFMRAPELWLDLCRKRAVDAGYRMHDVQAGMDVMTRFARDLAASTQKLFEADLFASVMGLREAAAEVGDKTDHLCLAGGAALNCPANSFIATAFSEWDLFVPPSCDNSGLALGAALLAQSEMMPEVYDGVECTAYLGRSFSKDEIDRALDKYSDRVRVEQCDNVPALAAEWLIRGKIIGWFEGRSEVGPRALGHRSILASPLAKENWGRVNAIKKRENWRPFAPAVPVDKAESWFVGAPTHSPYMLFTHTVLGGHKIPAVTHVDDSARVQTVSEKDGSFYKLLTAFEQKTGVPVLLNTSFNGPDEPIVDTPEDAITTFLDSALNALFFPHCVVRRR